MGPIRRASRVGFHMWDAGLTAHLLLPQQPRLLLDRQPTRTDSSLGATWRRSLEGLDPGPAGTGLARTCEIKGVACSCLGSGTSSWRQSRDEWVCG